MVNDPMVNIIGLLIPLLGTMLASIFLPAMPYLLAFAAGAINLSTIGFALGFVLMMVLDVVMG